MSKTHDQTQWNEEYEEDTDEFLENRRDTLEAIADGDYAFSERAQRLLDSINGEQN